MRLTVCRAVAQHDQCSRNKAVVQHLDIAPFSCVIQALQAAVCHHAQARRRRGPSPARHAQADRGHPQRKRDFRRHVRKINGQQCQRRPAQQQQPQAA